MLSEKVFYSEKPEAIKYMKLKTGIADVWLRKNIHQIIDTDGNHLWTADEVYLRTSASEHEIRNDFEEHFKTTEDAHALGAKASINDRIKLLEEALAALKAEVQE